MLVLNEPAPIRPVLIGVFVVVIIDKREKKRTFPPQGSFNCKKKNLLCFFWKDQEETICATATLNSCQQNQEKEKLLKIL